MSTHLILNNGSKIPALGYGTYGIKGPDGPRIVRDAIEAGYRHIDCALIYENEDIVGKGIKLAIDEGIVKREDLFITSKLWNTDHTPERIQKAIQKSLSNLGLKYLDLYLIHWPVNWEKDEKTGDSKRINGLPVIDTTLTIPQVYQEMEKLVDEKLVRNLGVSNFDEEEIESVVKVAKHKPVTNQVEAHPLWNQLKLEEAMKKHGMILTAYTPFAWNVPEGHIQLLSRPEVIEIAHKHKKSPNQVVLRWQIQHHRSVIPKSASVDRFTDNIDIFDFKLDDDDMKVLDNLKPQIRHSQQFGYRGVEGSFFKDN